MYKQHIQERIEKIKIIDKTVLHKILQIIQYSILYVIVGGVFGTFINSIFSEFNPDKKTHVIIQEVILQIILISFSVFYIRKIVKIVPYAGLYDTQNISNSYNNTFDITNSTTSVGEIMLVLVLIATQQNLLTKIQYLSNIFKTKISIVNIKIKNIIMNLFSENNKENQNDNQINNQNDNQINNQINNQNDNQNDNQINNQNDNQNDNQINNQINNQNDNQINNYSERIFPVNTREESNQEQFSNTPTQQVPQFNNTQTQQVPQFNNNQETSINSLNLDNFKPLENGGNFSFLNDNQQVNISKSLDYSSLLSQIT